jgi:hypothetical protein
LNAEQRQVDEIAVALACSPWGNHPPGGILKDNANGLYQIDEYLNYVDIIDYDRDDGNYYSTLQ